jgi:hypothetical protein
LHVVRIIRLALNTNQLINQYTLLKIKHIWSFLGSHLAFVRLFLLHI